MLTLLNGPLHQILNSKQSEIAKLVAKERTSNTKWSLLFQSVLGREPTSNDMHMISRVERTHGKRAVRIVLWALLNTREFMYIQ